MAESLLSVGLDVGTTTTQLIVSRLYVENKASSFAVPEMEIAEREILYRSQVRFTPLLDAQRVDGQAIAAWVKEEYQKANITPEMVQTGAVIITGETSRKENAKVVLESLSDMAGDFVVATAGPDLESVLAAKGAGALAYSEATGKTVLHMDIGGGTSNLALIENGQVVQTGCLNVGGRLIKLEEGAVSYLSPVLRGLTDLQVGDAPKPEQLMAVAKGLTAGLEMAAGLQPATELLSKLMTQEVVTRWEIPKKNLVISFSGGVADCIEKLQEYDCFGDVGPLLGQEIKKSRLCAGEYRLGEETIRATVIGAGCHSAQLSGSTVFCEKMLLPLKNLPVAVFTKAQQDSEDFPKLIEQAFQQSDSEKVVLAMPGYPGATYQQITQLGQRLMAGIKTRDLYVCLEEDMAKALGQWLFLQGRKNLCIDRVKLSPQSFLDVGQPIGPAIPVVVKTLILENNTCRGG